MPPQNAPLRTLEDIERLERVPLAERLAVGSTYELLQKALARSPEQPARCFLLLGNPSQPGEALTARAFLGKVHQTANLLADLGMGPPDAMALLLPDLLEKELLLWGGQAAGIVCPIPPSLPAPQVVDLLQVAQAKVLVAPAPEVDHELWQKTEQVRRQVKSIALVLQVRGPGNEREAAYAFDALVEDYPADRLHTGRQIALDDLAVCFPTRDTTGTPGLVPLTHGNLLYTAWARVIPLFAFPEDIRKVIYTTNAIESVNMTLRKVTRNHRIFPSDEAVYKVVYLAMRNIAKKWTMPIRDWKPALNRFAVEFAERFPR